MLKSKIGSVDFVHREKRVENSTFTLIDYIVYVIYKLMRVYYVCFYYYFMPFAVVFLTFAVTNYKEFLPLFEDEDKGGSIAKLTPTPSASPAPTTGP